MMTLALGMSTWVSTVRQFCRGASKRLLSLTASAINIGALLVSLCLMLLLALLMLVTLSIGDRILDWSDTVSRTVRSVPKALQAARQRLSWRIRLLEVHWLYHKPRVTLAVRHTYTSTVRKLRGMLRRD